MVGNGLYGDAASRDGYRVDLVFRVKSSGKNYGDVVECENCGAKIARNQEKVTIGWYVSLEKGGNVGGWNPELCPTCGSVGDTLVDETGLWYNYTQMVQLSEKIGDFR